MPKEGALTWDDLVALAISRRVDPEMPVLVAAPGGEAVAVYGLTVEDGVVVLRRES